MTPNALGSARQRPGAPAAVEAAVLDWVAANLSKVKEIMVAEQLVRFGTIELHYRNGHYIGLDTVCRNRAVTTGQ